MQGLVDDTTQDLYIFFPVVPECVLLPQTNLLTNSKINLLYKRGFILVPQEVVELANAFLMQLVLDGELELYLLSDVVLQLKGCSSCILELVEVKVDLRFRESDEALGWTQEVPAVVIDLDIVDLF